MLLIEPLLSFSSAKYDGPGERAETWSYAAHSASPPGISSTGTFTAGHPETGGANRSESERYAQVAVIAT